MKKIFMVALAVIFLLSCKNKSDELSGGKPVKPEVFLKAFNTLNLPSTIADTGLNKFGDTAVIGYAALTQFIPDSVLMRMLGKQAIKYAIHPGGSIHSADGDYVIAKFSLEKAIKLIVFLLNDKHKYVSSLELLNNYDNDKYHHSVSITSEPTFIIKRDKVGKDNEILYTRHSYAFNDTSNGFGEVMNESNEGHGTEIINPIDTFPATNKFSGEYAEDEKNFISVKDGKNAVTYSFFIHFEKNNGDCTGELKGQMSLTDEKNAIYQESGDPCVIHFKFSGNNVNVKEEGNCGNHRGITCPFDFTFRKKKIK